jgi:hypothetical protein
LIDVRILVGSAAVATAASFYGFAHLMTPTAEAATFVGITLVFGFVFATLSQPVPSLVIGSLPMSDLPAGIAIYKLTVPIGLMVGTSIIGSFVDHRAAFQASHIAANLTLSSSGVSSFVSHGGTLVKLNGLVIQQAQAVAYQDAMMLFCGITLLVVPLVAFAVPPSPPPPPPPQPTE